MREIWYLKAIFLVNCLTHVGKPYIWGGQTPINVSSTASRPGMDCSGYAQIVLDAFGIDPVGDQNAHGLYRHFLKPENGVELNNFTKPPIGALLFYSKTGGKKITHVAISIGSGLLVEAGGGGSRTRTVEDAIKQGAFVRVRPVNSRKKDLFSVILPKKLPWLSQI